MCFMISCSGVGCLSCTSLMSCSTVSGLFSLAVRSMCWSMANGLDCLVRNEVASTNIIGIGIGVLGQGYYLVDPYQDNQHEQHGKK